MKSLQESLLDDEIINNTSLESILAKSFPKPDEVENESLSDNYYWSLDKDILEQIVPHTHIDRIKASWTNDKSDKDKDIYVYIFHSPFVTTRFIIKSGSEDLKTIRKLSYSIMELLRDNIKNIKKLLKYCNNSKFKNNPPKLYKIDLYDIVK